MWLGMGIGLIIPQGTKDDRFFTAETQRTQRLAKLLLVGITERTEGAEITEFILVLGQKAWG